MKKITSAGALLLLVQLVANFGQIAEAADDRDKFLADGDKLWFVGREYTDPIPNKSSLNLIGVAFKFRKTMGNGLEVDVWAWRDIREVSEGKYVYSLSSRSTKDTFPCTIKKKGKVVEVAFETSLHKVRVTRRYSRNRDKQLIVRYFPKPGPMPVVEETSDDCPCEEPPIEDVYIEEEIPMDMEEPTEPEYYPPEV